jgi:PKD repeat protein
MRNLVKIMAILLFLSIAATGFAQLNQGGTPFSFQNSELLKSKPAGITMPAIDLKRLIAEDSVNDLQKDIPWRFGENMYVDYDMKNSGTWDLLPKGEKIWRLMIKSPGAYTINLTFNNYLLPPGAKLFIYNTDHSHVIGAFTDQNNQADRVFATTLVQGDEITIEYYEPAYPAFPGELHLDRITHGYRDAYKYAKSFGTSGSCNNNVNCPEAAGWESQIRSVCMLVSGGSGFCTGAIVNNTSNDGIPYILTANHCYSDPSSWVFWFNWQSPTCANPGSNPAYNSLSGATLKSRNTDSDFCLVQMNNTPPASYSPYYAGWNRENAGASSGAGIHHPDGDIKKISYSVTPFTSDTWSGTPADSHWKVNWSDGVTEPGSSGSPMFDQNHRIIGQLHGGPSACSGSSLWDFYGKFSMSWAQGATSATRLKEWLDPTNIAGLTLDGFDPYAGLNANFIANNTTICAGAGVTFTSTSTGSATSWAWSFPGGTPSTYNGVSPPAITYASSGTYDVSLTISDGTISDTETKTGFIVVKDLIANFTGTPTPVVVGNTVTFTDNSTCGPATWAWSFPGGTPSSYSGQIPPAITYSTTGTYDVSLTVTKPGSTDTKTRTGYIVVTPPVFNITNGSITTCAGDFYDTGGPTGSYLDGETITETFYPSTAGSMIRFAFTAFSTEQNFDTLTIYNGINSSAALIGKYHGTTSPGTVTASNASGALTFRFHSDPSVTSTGWAATISCYNINIPPVADFSASSTAPVVGQTITFTDLSTNVPTSWLWSFSPATVTYMGGTSATSKNPQVQFSALGAYSVTLTATNTYGFNTITKTNYINVTNCTFNTLPYSESFSGTVIPSCWTQIDNQGNNQVWQFGTITNQSPNPALTGTYAYLNSDTYGSGNSQNADLISPSLNLSAYTGITLQFSHYFKSYSGSSGTLSYSLNNGTTWTQIQQFTTTSATNPVAFSQLITALAGQPQVKFKWNYTGTWGYYWAIDNVQVTGTCISSPPVSIVVGASANPVCANVPVLFTATPANGGTTPAYQWKVDGTSIIGASNSTYSYVPASGNAVTCVLTSSSACVTGNPATSNPLLMIVNPVLPVSITISASANPVDAGTTVTFTATTVNGGGTPVYQWVVNAGSVGGNSDTYSYVPNNGDVVSCMVTSSDVCVSGNPATSASITMLVNSVPANTNINNILVSGSQCFDATQTIMVAGNGTTFVVPAGAEATMIAGENILFYPGTYVAPGGYLFGYISPGGPWCTGPAMPSIVAGTKTTGMETDHGSYTIYPNPTTGKFMVQWNSAETITTWVVEVYDMKGEKLYSTELSGEQMHEFSLSGKPNGIYMIRVIGGNTSGTTRIVKQ